MFANNNQPTSVGKKTLADLAHAIRDQAGRDRIAVHRRFTGCMVDPFTGMPRDALVMAAFNGCIQRGGLTLAPGPALLTGTTLGDENISPPSPTRLAKIAPETTPAVQTQGSTIVAEFYRAARRYVRAAGPEYSHLRLYSIEYNTPLASSHTPSSVVSLRQKKGRCVPKIMSLYPLAICGWLERVHLFQCFWWYCDFIRVSPREVTELARELALVGAFMCADPVFWDAVAQIGSSNLRFNFAKQLQNLGNVFLHTAMLFPPEEEVGIQARLRYTARRLQDVSAQIRSQ